MRPVSSSELSTGRRARIRPATPFGDDRAAGDDAVALEQLLGGGGRADGRASSVGGSSAPAPGDGRRARWRRCSRRRGRERGRPRPRGVARGRVVVAPSRGAQRGEGVVGDVARPRPGPRARWRGRCRRSPSSPRAAPSCRKKNAPPPARASRISPCSVERSSGRRFGQRQRRASRRGAGRPSRRCRAARRGPTRPPRRWWSARRAWRASSRGPGPAGRGSPRRMPAAATPASWSIALHQAVDAAEAAAVVPPSADVLPVRQEAAERPLRRPARPPSGARRASGRAAAAGSRRRPTRCRSRPGGTRPRPRAGRRRGGAARRATTATPSPRRVGGILRGERVRGCARSG